jgi:hypothetical protein
MRAREAAQYGAAVVVLLVLTILAARLTFAPIHGASSAAGCARAYAAARTHADTVSADLLSYGDSARGPMGRRRRCGDLRIATVDLTRH